jgi:hypothetical protein
MDSASFRAPAKANPRTPVVGHLTFLPLGSPFYLPGVQKYVMFLKVHRTPEGEIVAVCDRELLNTTLVHRDVEVQISETFYGNTPAGEEQVRAALSTATNANLFGRRTIEIAIACGAVDRGCVVHVGGVPHAQIFRF